MTEVSRGKVHWHDPFDDSEKTMDLDLHLARVMYYQLRDNSRKVWVTDQEGETVLEYEKKIMNALIVILYMMETLVLFVLNRVFGTLLMMKLAIKEDNS